MERSRSERKTQFSDVTCGKGSGETWHFITHPARVETLLLTESRWRGLQSGETEKVAVCKPGRGALTRNQRASTLTLAYPTSGPVRNKCLLSEPPRLWDLSQRPRRLNTTGSTKAVVTWLWSPAPTPWRPRRLSWWPRAEMRPSW